ncbi:hypothetical protein EDC94DRAFT_585836 [Helicostylum pulchrum]|nr:hypothetical protein EDC94DRAFT_585836 [Helicostylum pulchrum]
MPPAVNLVGLGRPFVTVVPIDRWRARKQVSAVYILLKSCQGITSYDWRCLSRVTRKNIKLIFLFLGKQIKTKHADVAFVSLVEISSRVATLVPNDENSCYGDGNLFEHRISSKRKPRNQVSDTYNLLKSYQDTFLRDWKWHSTLYIFSLKSDSKIFKAIKPVRIPEISDELVDYLNKFNNVKNTSGLRQLLMVRSFYQCYDPKEHADMDWICRTLDNLLPLYEIEGTFKRTNNERWYQNRIWTMVDKLLEAVQDIGVVRQDLIITRNETLELGVGEEKSYDNNTKTILERGIKCRKAMKDTLLQLFENVNYDSNLRKSLNVIGLLTFGLTLYIDILDNPVNYTCRITRSSDFTVPYKIEDLSENILPLLSALLSLKSIVANNSIMLSPSQSARKKLKSSLKRALSDTEDSCVVSKISCATTPEDNGRFVSVARKNQKRREN